MLINQSTLPPYLAANLEIGTAVNLVPDNVPRLCFFLQPSHGLLAPALNRTSAGTDYGVGHKIIPCLLHQIYQWQNLFIERIENEANVLNTNREL